MSYVNVFITAGDIAEAKTIREVLLKERLAACVQFIPIDSMWWWKDRLESAKEILIIAKTKSDRIPDIIREIKSIHGYEIPAVEVLPIIGGNPDFFKWIDEVLE